LAEVWTDEVVSASSWTEETGSGLWVEIQGSD